jgi:hypothetical protein
LTKPHQGLHRVIIRWSETGKEGLEEGLPSGELTSIVRILELDQGFSLHVEGGHVDTLI